MRITPHYLIQRSIKGYTNSFQAKDSSIFSAKVKDDITFADNFSLDYDIRGNFKDWDINLKQSLNSLNNKRFSQALRSKFTISKSFILTQNNNNLKNDFFNEQNNIIKNEAVVKDKNNSSYENLIDLKFTKNL